MIVTVFPTLNDNYTFIININDKVIIVDPGESKDLIDYLSRNNLKVSYIFNTHHHYDHTDGNFIIKKTYNAKIFAPKLEKNRIQNVDYYVENQQKINIEGTEFEVIDLPGHTKGHIGFYCQKHDMLFCGDVLFSAGCGKIFEGSFEQMYKSLQKICSLPLHTKIYCAHEYTQKNIEFALSIEPSNKKLLLYKEEVAALRKKNKPTIPTTLKLELDINPFLRINSQELQTKLGVTNKNEVFIFQKLRCLKDKF